MYTLRLKVETKKVSKNKYQPEYIDDIKLSVRAAAKKYNIANYVFESVVSTDSQGILKYCAFTMTPEMFIFFCNAYGSIKTLEKDYQIIEHK